MSRDSDDEDDEHVCPLCVEEVDISDRDFLPCPCGYRVCMWCWHHIRENLNGLCPACRTPYNEDPHHFTSDKTETSAKHSKEKEKTKKDRKIDKDVRATSQKAGLSNSNTSNSNNVNVDRKHLHNYRVVQRNLVYVIGMPANTAGEEMIRKPEYFGQYGKIVKTVIHRNNSISLSTVSAYVTFAHKEDARAAIQALDGYWLEGHQLRASFGTTKYCNSFVRGVACANPDCVYLHDFGEDEDRYTKEDIINPSIAVTAVNPSTTNSTASSHGKVGSSSVLITGQGGPSGTGKIVKGESILPAPVFTQEVAVAAGNPYVLASITAKEEKEKANKKNSSNSGGESKQKATAPASSWAATIAATNASSALATNTNNTASGASASDNSDLSGSQNQGVNKTANATGSSSGQVSPNQTSLTAPANSNSNSNSNSSSVAARDGLDTLVQAVAPIQHFQYNAYNGFGRNVIFPVPTSTFQLSVWYNIMVTATNDLSVNPFAMYASSIVTDFLELTLPPVDAIGAIASWPKPLSAYGCSSIPNIGGRMFQSDEANMQNIQQIMLEKSNLIDSHNNKNSVRSNKPSIQPLQQLFPGVKMHYGSGATN